MREAQSSLFFSEAHLKQQKQYNLAVFLRICLTIFAVGANTRLDVHPTAQDVCRSGSEKKNEQRYHERSLKITLPKRRDIRQRRKCCI